MYIILLHQDNFINVLVDHSVADAMSGCTISCMARSYLFEITYYQTGKLTQTTLQFLSMSVFEHPISPPISWEAQSIVSLIYILMLLPYHGRHSLSCL